MVKRTALSLLLLATVATGAAPAADVDLGRGSSTGAPALLSAGPLAFGPDGVLFVGDSLGAAIWAIDTGDVTAAGDGPLELEGVDTAIAALAGTTPDQIRIHDLAVNPLSRRAYLSVSRGQGAEAKPAIFTVSPGGKLELFALDQRRHARAALDDAPDAEATGRRGESLRLDAITDLAWSDGRVLVAGLSNEEFSSKLRVLDFPFGTASRGASVEIFHGSHGRWETNAPVRTFTTVEIDQVPHILAAYTCTPLVKMPLAGLLDGAKVRGTTVAELGNRNRPLDMVVYSQEGRDYLLMANSSRGVMKVDLTAIAKIEAIVSPVPDVAGLAFQTIADLQGVEHLDRLDASHALLLVLDGGARDLRTVALP
jgi:hypothetical protein